MSQTFYDVLEVSPDATQEEITDAYRAKVKEYHPDVSDRDDAADLFREVVRAEEVLGDEEERETYDRLGHEAYVSRVDAQNAADGEHSPWTTSDRSDRGRSRGRERSQRDRDRGARSAESASSSGQARSDGFGRADSSQGFGSAADRQHASGATGAARDRWSSSGYGSDDDDSGSTYSVHDWDDEKSEPDTVTIDVTQEIAIVAASIFVLYPLLVFVSVSGSFPTFANIAVGACTLLVIGYMLTIPKVAVGVFGAWSFATPIALLTILDWGMMPSLFALAVCWIPFGYAVGVAYVVRPR